MSGFIHIGYSYKWKDQEGKTRYALVCYSNEQQAESGAQLVRASGMWEAIDVEVIPLYTCESEVQKTTCGHSPYDPCHNCEPVDEIQ